MIGAVLADYQVSDLSIVDPDLEGVLRQIYAQRRDDAAADES